MTQEAVIRALQNGPLTSYQLEDLTGIPRLSIAACCTKMRYKKKLKIGKIDDLIAYRLKKEKLIKLKKQIDI